MTTTRRLLLGAAGLAPFARAASAQQPRMVIEPITPSSGLGTPYSRFANVGPLGMPKSPYRMSVGGLQLDIYLPPGRSEGRVVVFSHAELTLPQTYERLLSHWASHGFIVVAPLHDDSVLVNGLKARRESVRGGDWDLGSVINDAAAWKARPRALRAALDALPRLEQTSGIRFLDERPVVVGHSFGAFSAQLLLGARAMTSDGTVMEEADPRFYAGVLMSPQGRGILGLADGSWDTLARPIIAITGNGDTDATGQDPNIKLEPFALSPPGNRHLAWFSRIAQTLYSGQQVRPGTTEQLLFQDQLCVTTAFLVAYADYDQKTLLTLSGDEFAKDSSNRLTIRYR